LFEPIQSLLVANDIKPIVCGQGGLLDAPEIQRLRVFLRWLDDDNDSTYGDLFALSGRTVISCRRALKKEGYTASLLHNRLRVIDSQDSSLQAFSSLGGLYTRLQFAGELHEKVSLFGEWLAEYDETFDAALVQSFISRLSEASESSRALMSRPACYTNSQILTTVHDPYPVDACHRLQVFSAETAERFSEVPRARTPAPETLTTMIYRDTHCHE